MLWVRSQGLQQISRTKSQAQHKQDGRTPRKVSRWLGSSAACWCGLQQLCSYTRILSEASDMINTTRVAICCRQAELQANCAAGHRQPWTIRQGGQKGWVDTAGSLGQESRHLKRQRTLGGDAPEVSMHQNSHSSCFSLLIDAQCCDLCMSGTAHTLHVDLPSAKCCEGPAKCYEGPAMQLWCCKHAERCKQHSKSFHVGFCSSMYALQIAAAVAARIRHMPGPRASRQPAATQLPGHNCKFDMAWNQLVASV